MHRRDFLRAVFLGAAGAALPAWARFGDASAPLTPDPLAGAGALVDTGVDGIRAAAGFRLRAVARHLHNPVNGRLDPLGISGYPWHKAPDGGGCFKPPDGGWAYVSNCESKSAGGGGALRFDRDGRIADAYRILGGTRRNCASGIMPWGSWLSCEEVGDGLFYECGPFGSPHTARVRPALGRFNHEAATADVTTRSVYMTRMLTTAACTAFSALACARTGPRRGWTLPMAVCRCWKSKVWRAAATPTMTRDAPATRRSLGRCPRTGTGSGGTACAARGSQPQRTR